jgi:predicted nucleotidyltransferase
VRIPQTTRRIIKDLVSRLVPDSECYLFGSRTIEDAKGGDIDLLLITPEKIALRQILTLRREILNQIGEQKIDIVNFPKTSNHPFLKIAMDGAIRI